jgi:hypothetical protein
MRMQNYAFLNKLQTYVRNFLKKVSTLKSPALNCKRMFEL